MLINDNIINNLMINGEPPPSEEGLILESVLDSMDFTEGLSYSELANIIEEINMLLNIQTNQNTSDSVSELLNIIDSQYIILDEISNDLLTLSEDSVPVINQIIFLLDDIRMSEVWFNNSSIVVDINELIDILDNVSYGILKTILETLNISDTLSQLITAITNINDGIILSFSNAPSSLYLHIIEDEMDMLETIDNFTIFNSLLSDNFILTIEDSKGDDTYSSYLLSPETFSVSTYSNYNFTGSCKFNDEYLFINENGLYRYGGTLDDSEIIQAEIETAALSFGTSNLKQIPNFYMGLSNSNKIVLKVSVDGQATVYYKLNKKTDHLQSQLIKIGKGLIGRYFQFELITQDNTQFELESLEFTPITLKRKL